MTFKLDFPANLCRAAFAIIAMFVIMFATLGLITVRAGSKTLPTTTFYNNEIVFALSKADRVTQKNI